jgi:hypothetical protein
MYVTPYVHKINKIKNKFYKNWKNWLQGSIKSKLVAG